MMPQTGASSAFLSNILGPSFVLALGWLQVNDLRAGLIVVFSGGAQKEERRLGNKRARQMGLGSLANVERK